MTCKLYLVPEDVINSWRSEQREKAIDLPVNAVASQVDSKMSSILKKDMTDYDKEKLYAQELERLRTLRNQKVVAPSPKAVVSLTTIPLLYQRKAEALLDYLKSNKVSWDERGQVKIGDQVLDRSNIVDLVSDAIRFRKLAKRPAGWRELSRHLDRTNVPRELVGNPEWIKEDDLTDDTVTPASEFESYSDEDSEFHDATDSLKQTTKKRKLPARKARVKKVGKWESLSS